MALVRIFFVKNENSFKYKIDTLCRGLFKTLLRVGIPAWILIALYDSIDQLISHQIEQILRSPNGLGPQIWLFGFMSLFAGLFFPLLITLVILYGLKKSAHSLPTHPHNQLPIIAWGEFLSRNISPLSIETLRSWGKSLMWAYLLIVPGFVRFISYLFVPFIVCFSRNYQDGKLDALQYSAQIFKKRWKSFLFLVVLFQIAIPILLTSVADSYRVIWETPLASLVVSLIETLVWIVYLEILFALILPIFKEVNDELVV